MLYLGLFIQKLPVVYREWAMKVWIMLILAVAGPMVLALPKDDGATVKDSVIVNVNNDAKIDAKNRSSVNTGIQARGATISNSTMVNNFSGNVTARNNSQVSTGIKADDAQIKDSTITVDTKANITADHATVKTGVDVNEARNATINTSYKGEINAAGSTVKAGSVEGEVRHKKITTQVEQDINAVGRGVKIGTVTAGSGQGTSHVSQTGLDYSKAGRNSGGASIGNVDAQGGIVREVKTTVGTSNGVVNGLKVRHMAKVYAEEGGIDPTGTKNVYVSRKEKEKALKTGGSVGNTTTGDPRIKKVETYVE